MTTDNAANKMTSRAEGRELILERIFDAPRELVFKVFSESEHLKRWFGPKGWTLPVSNLDFRPGGVWHYCMKCTDESNEYYGQESWGKTVYHEIVEPERIVYVDSFSDAEGHIVKDMPETLITMTFVEHEGKTKLINHAQYASAEALKTVMDMGMLQGITETWDNLDKYLEEIK
ncbi:SRPBCC domain-containing protein [Cohnella silvisoli]|uniref:SRPBCC domain-containing protein n=1 Tax=Cohnella silvisoli TaxID=2873699 RepID=A0ABV1KSR3_9BACL|nr:SRPBCC domain-containing protein [Cohnella silvisoli]MCD9021402.1 SRPBCC domain-containing protein [Cohnella silvisoli]